MATARDLRYRRERDELQRTVIALAMVIAAELPHVHLEDVLDPGILAQVRQRLAEYARTRNG